MLLHPAQASDQRLSSRAGDTTRPLLLAFDELDPDALEQCRPFRGDLDEHAPAVDRVA
jgi:hypothetical protein